jgi:hypothetical protein
MRLEKNSTFAFEKKRKNFFRETGVYLSFRKENIRKNCLTMS